MPRRTPRLETETLSWRKSSVMPAASNSRPLVALEEVAPRVAEDARPDQDQPVEGLGDELEGHEPAPDTTDPAAPPSTAAPLPLSCDGAGYRARAAGRPPCGRAHGPAGAPHPVALPPRPRSPRGRGDRTDPTERRPPGRVAPYGILEVGPDSVDHGRQRRVPVRVHEAAEAGEQGRGGEAVELRPDAVLVPGVQAEDVLDQLRQGRGPPQGQDGRLGLLVRRGLDDVEARERELARRDGASQLGSRDGAPCPSSAPPGSRRCSAGRSSRALAGQRRTLG